MIETIDLSVIFTVHNKPLEQVLECVQSVKDQTMKPKEMILVDDGSKEPHAHASCISIVLPQNVGVSKARDVGFRVSTGKLILFVDGDDKLAPDFLEQCGKCMDKFDIAYPNVLFFGEMEQPMLAVVPPRVTPQYILGKKCGVMVTSMMHRRVYEKNQGFRSLAVYEDWDFWIRALCNGYTFKHANTLLYYRQVQNTRHRISADVRASIHKQITENYLIKGDKLCPK